MTNIVLAYAKFENIDVIVEDWWWTKKFGERLLMGQLTGYGRDKS